jgi:large subunit ribosomal protein L7/L12
MLLRFAPSLRVAARQQQQTVIRTSFRGLSTATETEEEVGPVDPKVQEVVDIITSLNLTQVTDVVSILNKKLNLPAAMPMGMMPMGGGMPMGGAGGGGAAAPEAEEVVEEQTAFDVKITSYDAKDKIKIIKEVRSITSLGLKEAKALVEALPVTVSKGIKKELADELVEKLKKVGAIVETV